MTGRGVLMANVLVVDDDTLYRSLMVEALQLGGFLVQEAHSPASALRILSTHPNFDVMICDLQMEGLDGIELLRTLRTDYPRIPVVVVSAHSASSGIGLAAQPYAIDYLSKPFSLVRLISTIRKAAAPPAPRA